MSKTPTNTDLKKLIDDGFKAANGRFNKLEDRMQTFHDYMTGEVAVKNSQSSSSSGTIPKELIDIVKWLVLIIGTLVGAKNIL